jgi:glycosyltransferase involved in cell wall biosynthesis
MILKKSSKVQALISTIEPVDGGVPTMTRWICRLLEELNIIPVLAWYAPWRNYPLLSVPFYKLLRGRKPLTVHQVAFEKYESYGIGSWLPELEFTHYMPSRNWNRLVDNCDLHLAVSGNALCALPYLRSQISFLAWIATPWEADRKDRIRKFSLPRRILDTTINTPILKDFEKKILAAPKGQILCLSNYTLKEINHLSPAQKSGLLYMPVDTSLFKPDSKMTIPWRIGFSGRYCDPRKNIELLLSAARLLLDWNNPIELILVGDKNMDQIRRLIRDYGIEKNIICYGHMNPTDLAPLLQTFDIFVIPSHQEGLCIAALEAMACGVPVISTRCGGPEDFVHPGITGELVDKNADVLALKIKNFCMGREKRDQMASAAVNWIRMNASENASRLSFQRHLRSLASYKGVRID